MDKAGEVFEIVAALLDDPEQDFATDDYLRPFLQLAQNRLFENVYGNPNVGGAKGVVILPNVAAGTSDLQAFFQPGQPLENLAYVFSMKEKPSGQQDISYRPMRPAYDIPIGGGVGVIGSTLPFFNTLYVFSSGTILIPGANQNMDFRIFGEFRPVQITDGESPLIPGSKTVLTHWTAELVGMTRGAMPEFIAYQKNEKDLAIAELFNNLIMQIQEIPNQQRPYDTGSIGQGYAYFE